jgi:hypothetical protein
MFLHWNNLNEEEKKQAELSYISFLEDFAAEGDPYDVSHYEEISGDEKLLKIELEAKSFLRDPDGYIFINF